MKTLLTLFALGAGLASAQGNGHNASDDPTALTATQYTFNIRFGAGTSCPGDTPPICFAVTTFTVPAGNRLVIENISATLTFNPNGSADMPQEALSIGLNVNGSVVFMNIPFQRTQTQGASTTYFLDKQVRLYADPGIGFPELLVENLNDVGPVFRNGNGFLGISIQGHLVPTS